MTEFSITYELNKPLLFNTVYVVVSSDCSVMLLLVIAVNNLSLNVIKPYNSRV